MFGYCCHLGICTITVAELIAIFNGLQIAFRKGYRRIIVESDSQVALKLLSDGCSPSHPCHMLIYAIKEIFGKLEEVHSCHIAREGNSVADAFAKYGLTLGM